MKIIAVYDNEGRILAAVMDDGKYRGPRPVPAEGTHGGTFEVPASVHSLSLEEICTTFRVDPKSKTLAKKPVPPDRGQSM
jgi:hypothetical protein